MSLWWAFHLISNIVNQISFRLGMRSDDPDLLHALAWVDLATIGWDVALLLIEIKLVKGLTDLQDHRASTLFARASGTPPGQWPMQG